MLPYDDTAEPATATFAEAWLRAATMAPERSFLVWADEDRSLHHEWTYGEFNHLVSAVATGLARFGLHRGDGVHLALGNCPAFVAIWLACARIGAYIIPSDPRAPLSDHLATIKRSRPALHVGRHHPGLREELLSAQVNVRFISVNEEDMDLAALTGNIPPGDDQIDLPSGHDVCGLLYTSGTTSEPKGVLVTQANYAFAGTVMANAAALRSSDRFLVCLPLFHANAQYYCFAAAIHVGASVALMSRFSASRFIRQAERVQATHASLFAAPVRMILQRTVATESGYRLQHVWYAQDLSADDYAHATELFGCRPRQLYGMTETIAAVLTSHPLEAVGDVIGPVTLGCHARLGDEMSGRPVQLGQLGEILVTGRRGIELFAGYAGDALSTAQSFRDNWFRTGDLAWADDSGRYHFAGRSGERLKVGGENVSLLSIESVLAEHPSIAEAAVIGGHHPMLDEVPIALIVVRPGIDPEQARPRINDWCAERLAPAARPHRIVFVPELPHTSVGKIRRHNLQQLLPAD